jgi:hypothetical protein
MILQELIRNFILYREVVKPMLSSWRDSLTTGYYKGIAGYSSSELIFALHTISARDGGEELGWDISDDYEAMSLTQISGTRTITDKHIIFQDKAEARTSWHAALLSRKIPSMLTSAGSHEKTIDTGKTNSLSYEPSQEIIILATKRVKISTTGSESKQIKSFLITETHEKREYLGEFSLTHEETPLYAFSERGCES